jgi:tetratricopeptide (TPR) repeat protein
MYGGKLEPGTLEEAETIFRRAIEIAPKRLIHRVELGKLLLDMQRKDEAHAELKLAMTLPREDINSEHERRDAVELLKKHWGEKVEIPQFADPPPTPPPRLSSVSRRSSFDTGSGGARRSFDDVRENPFLTKAAQQAAAA